MMDRNAIQFDANSSSLVFPNTSREVHKDQLRRMMKKFNGFDRNGNEKYKIEGKVTSKNSIDEQDDMAMSNLLCILWATRHLNATLNPRRAV